MKIYARWLTIIGLVIVGCLIYVIIKLNQVDNNIQSAINNAAQSATDNTNALSNQIKQDCYATAQLSRDCQ